MIRLLFASDKLELPDTFRAFFKISDKRGVKLIRYQRFTHQSRLLYVCSFNSAPIPGYVNYNYRISVPSSINHPQKFI